MPSTETTASQGPWLVRNGHNHSIWEVRETEAELQADLEEFPRPSFSLPLALAAEQMDSKLRALSALVDAQAEDEGLWFQTPDAPTAYIQQALRRLHHAIEEWRMIAAAEGTAP